MTFERRAWFIVDATILVVLLVSLRLVDWQMIRGPQLLPGSLLTGVAEQGDLNNSSDDNQELQALLHGQVGLGDADAPGKVLPFRISQPLVNIERK